MKNFTVPGKVWRYPHPNIPESGWYFVYVPEKLSQQIRDTARNRKKTSHHFVRIKATVGKTSWTTSLFPTKDGPYLIAIKADVRKKEDVDEGDTIRVSCVFL